jgi:hypothetical protein
MSIDRTPVVARGAAESAKLPDRMLGAWCGSWGYQFPDNDAEHWWRTNHVTDCANRGGIRIRKDGYDYNRFGPLGSCRFTKIEFSRQGKPTDHVRPQDADGKLAEAKREPPSDVYLIEATCKDGTRSWRESYFVQTTDDWLIRVKPNGD